MRGTRPPRNLCPWIKCLVLFISYKSWQKRGRLIPLCFDTRLADASGSAALRVWSISFMRFRMRSNLNIAPNIGELSPALAIGSLLEWNVPVFPMARRSRGGPPRPLGPMHPVHPTFSPSVLREMCGKETGCLACSVKSIDVSVPIAFRGYIHDHHYLEHWLLSITTYLHSSRALFQTRTPPAEALSGLPFALWDKHCMCY